MCFHPFAALQIFFKRWEDTLFHGKKVFKFPLSILSCEHVSIILVRALNAA